MLSESTAGDVTWHGTEYEWRAGMMFFPPQSGSFLAPLPDVHPINARGTSGNRYDTARPSGNHPRGVNAVFCGGNARFIRDDMTYRVYCALMTAHGANAVDPGTTIPTATVRVPTPLTSDSF